MALNPIAPALTSIPAAGAPGAAARAAGGAPSAGQASGFSDALRQVLGAVDGSTAEANQAVGRMLEGTGDVHEAMIALQRADTTLQLTVQIRNKIVQAYQDVMRMSI
jgi:flagellar hook-basal body complex protein FliE